MAFLSRSFRMDSHWASLMAKVVSKTEALCARLHAEAALKRHGTEWVQTVVPLADHCLETAKCLKQAWLVASGIAHACNPNSPRFTASVGPAPPELECLL